MAIDDEESDLDGIFGMIDMGLGLAEAKLKEMEIKEKVPKMEDDPNPTGCSYCGEDMNGKHHDMKLLLVSCPCERVFRACRKCVKSGKAVQRIVLHLSTCEELER